MKNNFVGIYQQYSKHINVFINACLYNANETSFNQETIIQYELKKEQYLTFLAINILSVLLHALITLMGVVPPLLFLMTIILAIGYTCLLYFKQYNIACMIYLIRGFIISKDMMINPELKHMLLITQLFIIILPIIGVIFTRSIKITIFFYVLCVSLTFHGIFLRSSLEHNQIPIGFSAFAYAGFAFSMMISLVIWRLMESQKNLLIQLDEKKRFLEKLNTELVTKNDQLKESLQAKDTFLLSVSHEFRNPLNIIMGSADLAMFNEHTFPKAYLENIKSSAELIELFINNLLDSAKMEKVNLELCCVKVDMIQFIEKIWNTSRILINKKRLQGKIFIQRNIPAFLNLDPIRIIQVVYNLVGNAVKFTNSGYISIICSWIPEQHLSLDTIAIPTQEYLFRQILEASLVKSPIFNRFFHHTQNTFMSKQNLHVLTNIDNNDEIATKPIDPMNRFATQSLTTVKTLAKYYQFNNNQLAKIIKTTSNLINKEPYTHNGYLKIEIIDSGPGINENSITDLFKKFSQVGANSNKQLGTGLGLWISHNLCKNMKGTLKAYSKEGIGSVFVALIKSSTYYKGLC